MNKVFAASALIAAMIAATAANAQASHRERSVLLNCAGLERTQSAAPDDSAPDANSGAQSPDGNSDDGSADDNAQSPSDGGSGDDDGANSDQDAPPDTAQPPGCIFQNKPLELLV